ncbi:hypothetical protein GCM10028778_02240 [Barrientosiimonas marina]|uniref:Uncharacterized protein n=1 Tax=Lentibacillus kimchii TaxID=1542911 RepID=A0ABW2UUA2_9BACI
MKYVIEDLQKQTNREDLPVLRLEIDYELMTLYDAIQAKERVQISRSKEKLKHLRLQLLAFSDDDA